MKKNTLIKVLNRFNGSSVYSIPEMGGLRRVFQPGETKEVSFEELEKLSYIPGGRTLLENNLVILDNKEAISLLLGHVEPEYFYTKENIIKLMKQGSLEEFLDCLDFAPDGVKQLIKNLSVTLPLNDVQKREAILNKLGFNVDNAIRINKEIFDTQETHEENTPHRRVQKAEPEKTVTTRRVVREEN